MSNPTPPNSPWIIDATPENFQTEVMERSREVPVVVDFWAAWCQPCRLLAPLLESLVKEYDGQFVLVKADTEQVPEIAGQFQVQGIPAVFGVRDGQIVDFFNGLLPEPQLREWIERLIPSPAERLVMQARLQIETSPAQAEEQLRAALDLDPELVPAKITLAEVLLTDKGHDPDKTAEANRYISELEERGFLEPEAEKVKAALELRQEGDTSGSIESCRAELAANPENFALQLALAKSLAAESFYEEALQISLKLVEEDRHKTGEEAKDLMIDVFRLLPDDSKLTSNYRRKLSTALY